MTAGAIRVTGTDNQRPSLNRQEIAAEQSPL
jgi:hypothetical protein